MTSDRLQKAVIRQRTRNRVIEYLQMLCTHDSDPPPWDLNETLNQWEDWTSGDDKFPIPPYTEQEYRLLKDVHVAWERFCDVTPAKIVDQEAAMLHPEWKNLMSAAEIALGELIRRGPQSESAKDQPPPSRDGRSAI